MAQDSNIVLASGECIVANNTSVFILSEKSFYVKKLRHLCHYLSHLHQLFGQTKPIYSAENSHQTALNYSVTTPAQNYEISITD